MHKQNCYRTAQALTSIFALNFDNLLFSLVNNYTVDVAGNKLFKIFVFNKLSVKKHLDSSSSKLHLNHQWSTTEASARNKYSR